MSETHTHSDLQLICDWKDGTYSVASDELVDIVIANGKEDSKKIIEDKYGCNFIVACCMCMATMREIKFPEIN